MAASSLSKYAENQFLTATAKSFALMSEILADTLPRATTAIGGNPAFSPVMTQLQAAADAWDLGETAIANAEAALPAATLALDDKLAALLRKPDADTPSLLEQWDIVIRTQTAHRGPLYRELLPHGRRTLLPGTREEQLDALHGFATRLSAQTAKPALVALGATVTTFSNAARQLRTTQTQAKATLEKARADQEPRRVAAAQALYALIGMAMAIWNATPARVDTLWDVNLLRPTRRPQPAPTAAPP